MPWPRSMCRQSPRQSRGFWPGRSGARVCAGFGLQLFSDSEHRTVRPCARGASGVARAGPRMVGPSSPASDSYSAGRSGIGSRASPGPLGLWPGQSGDPVVAFLGLLLLALSPCLCQSPSLLHRPFLRPHVYKRSMH